MSMDPGTMQQMLAQRLQQGQQGGAQQGPQVQSQVSPFQAASQIAQKALLMKALYNQQQGNAGPLQTMHANAMMPASQATMANDPTMQSLQGSPQSTLTPDQLQQLQQPLPAAQMSDPTMTTDGFS